MAFKHWAFSKVDKGLATSLAEECNTDNFIALIAASRGYTDPSELDEFLSEDLILSDPFELADMEKAVDVIWDAIYSEELIAIYGDYDVDGITATALLYSYLKNKGAKVIYYIPSRENDGYGMNIPSIDMLHEKDVGLIITVDNGIASVSEIDYAKSLGMKVVVTDHHLPQNELPTPDALINPHRADDMTEFKDICGVTVAFKLLCALEGKSPEDLIYDYGPLVALGTVADVMPLKYENRGIVREGLKAISDRCNLGLSALIREAGISQDELTATKLAYAIAPRINAAGRMGDAARGVELLITEDDEAAISLSQSLNSDNIKRQSVEKQIFTEAVKKIEKQGFKHNRVIVVSGENWHGGVVGIVASRIAEKYGKPTIVLSENSELSHGSARSVGDFSIYNAIKECAYLLTKFGGHEMAAGLSLYTSSIDDFRRRINEYANNLKMPCPELKIDCKLKPSALSLDLVEDIKILEPFGNANPVPQFALLNLTITRITAVGGGKHLRLNLFRDGVDFTAMLFGVNKNAFGFAVGDTVDIVVTLDINVFGGEQSLSVFIKDIRKSKLDEEILFEQIDLYENFKSGVDSDYTKITPTRQEVGVVYKQILSSPAGLDRVINANIETIGYAKALISAEALCQLGIFKFFDFDGEKLLRVEDKNKKVNLSDCDILKRLGGGVYET